MSTTPLAEQIYRYYVRRDGGEPFRSHLGASEIGGVCERAAWLSFRWARREVMPGRMYRLFDTGKMEESRIAADLRAVGLHVELFNPLTGWQFSYSAIDGHFGGSIDGKVSGGELARTHVLEMKTHNDKSFKGVVLKGVKVAKPEHYWQMQAYMGLSGLNAALYVAVNKNTDELYTEAVTFDDDEFGEVLKKAERVIFGKNPPARISEKPTFFGCQFCRYRPMCFEGELPEEKNCRTCLHSTPLEAGAWRCEARGKLLTLDEQRAGCEEHLFIPKLVPAGQVDVVGEGEAVVYDGGLVNIRGKGWQKSRTKIML